jgi:hypothetical protein
VTASEPLCWAQLRFDTLPALKLAAGESNLWTGTLKATTNASYSVDLLDFAGHKGGNETPYHLVVLPDEPPNVAITEPDMDIRAQATARVPLKISATDDYGVEEIKLFFHKVGGPEQQVVCRKISTANGREATATAEIDLAALHLKDYELAAYHAEATDNNTLDGPGVGKSPVYFIEVTSKEKTLSQCNGSSQKINLLQLEKQLIAATSAEKAQAARSERLLDLAATQRQTQQYAELFQGSFIMSASPPEARMEFASAIKSMEKAAGALDAQHAAPALQAEEEALAHLYQVARLLPEFESMCQGGKGGNCTKIVLEAIEKLKQEQKDKLRQDLPKILAEAKRVAAEQARLNDLYLPPRPEGEAAPAEGSKKGQNPTAPKPGMVTPGGTPTPKSAEAETPGANEKESAEQQRKLSEAARALSSRIRELSVRDPRIGHRYSENMGQASESMRAAADAANRGNLTSAGAYGNTSWHGVSSVIAGLEKLLQAELLSGGADVAAEEFPKEFETPISEYFRRLSYEE